MDKSYYNMLQLSFHDTNESKNFTEKHFKTDATFVSKDICKDGQLIAPVVFIKIRDIFLCQVHPSAEKEII